MRELRPLIWLVFLGFGLLLFRGTLLGGQVFVGGEVIAHQMPLQKAAADAVHAGRLPVWAPELACGFPLLGEGEAAVLYPARALEYFTALPYYQAYSWTVFLQCVLAALGAALLARRVGLGYLAATFAGLAFGFSGYLVSQVPDLPLLQSAAWLPWLLAGLIGGVESGAWAWFVLAAAAWALSLYGGGAQVCVLEAVVALLVLLWLLLAPGKTPWWRKLARVSFGGLGALALGSALGAAQLLPSLDLAESSGWHLGRGASVFLHLHPLQLLYYLNPYLLGGDGDMGLWSGRYHADCGYVGGLTVLLALAALFLPRLPLRHRWLWVILGALGVTWALGLAQPAYNLLGTSPLYPAPGLGLLLAALSLPLLAAGLVDALARSERRKSAAQALAIWGLIALAAYGAAVWYAHQPHLPDGAHLLLDPDWDPYWITFGAGLAVAALVGLLVWLTRLPHAAAAGLLLAALGAQLYLADYQANMAGPAAYFLQVPAAVAVWRQDPRWGREYTDPGVETTDLDVWEPRESGIGPHIRWPSAAAARTAARTIIAQPHSSSGWEPDPLAGYRETWDILSAGSPLLWAVPTANAKYALLPYRQADLLTVRLPAGLDAKPEGLHAPLQVLRMLGVRTLSGQQGMHAPWLELLSVRGPFMATYRLAAPMPRAWLPRQVVPCASDREALGGVAWTGFLPEDTAYVEGVTAEQLRERTGARGTVRLSGDKATSLTFEVQTPAPSFLVVNMAYNPHWRATVGGEAAELYRANYVQCGLLVPAGKSTVRLEYVPDDLYLGAQIAAVAACVALLWLLLAAAGAWAAGRRRPAAPEVTAGEP